LTKPAASFAKPRRKPRQLKKLSVPFKPFSTMGLLKWPLPREITVDNRHRCAPGRAFATKLADMKDIVSRPRHLQISETV